MEDQESQQQPTRQQTTKIPNILIDAALNEIRAKIIQQGYSEVHLPPSESEFSEKRLGITWNGTLILTNGKLRGLETLYRVGEAALSFNEYMNNRDQHIEITFTVDLGLTSPTTANDFRLIFMKREMEGMAIGTLSHVTFTLTLGLNAMTRKMRLIDLKFKHLGHGTTEIKGLGTVLDFLASKLTKVILNRTKWQMAVVAEQNVKETLREIIENMKWPMPDQQNVLIGGIQSAFGGGGGTSSSSGGAAKGENDDDAAAGPSNKSKFE